MGFILIGDLELIWHLGHSIGLNIHANNFFLLGHGLGQGLGLKVAWLGGARWGGFGVQNTSLLNGAGLSF